MNAPQEAVFIPAEALRRPVYRKPVRAVSDAMVEAMDPARAERSLALEVHPQGGGHYHVIGGAEGHHVNFRDPSVPMCDCADHTWRSKTCKHIVACLIVLGDPRVLGFMVGIAAVKRAAEKAN
jgi:hypothetical protein